MTSRTTTHVFIVGLPRTGTTLTRNILNRSPLVGLGGESHFFATRRRMGLARRPGVMDELAQAGDPRTDEGVCAVVDAIFARRGRNFWGRIAAGAGGEEFGRALRASDRTPRAILDLALAHYAAGRPIRGEKTPAHLNAVPELLRWYTGARVIHCLRDPRAVYVSNRRKYGDERLTRVGRLARRLGPLFELYAGLDVALQFRRAVRLHHRYEREYGGRYTLIRFEDLVRAPQETVEQLCAFVGIPFEPDMLDQVVANSSYLPKGSAAGIDPEAVDRWRGHLSPLVDRWMRLWAGRSMAEFGYG